jgi:hypothetical protein
MLPINRFFYSYPSIPAIVNEAAVTFYQVKFFDPFFAAACKGRNRIDQSMYLLKQSFDSIKICQWILLKSKKIFGLWY